MAETANDINHEMLKSVRMRGMPAHATFAHADIANSCQLLPHMGGQLACIEQRLDMIDEPAGAE